MSIKQIQPLYLIVGDQQVSPCDHETYRRFKLWLVSTHGSGKIDSFEQENITIEHWDDQAAGSHPYLMNPCECGTFLPIDLQQPGPMFSSSTGLLADMISLKQHYNGMEPEFQNIVDQLFQMAELSVDTKTALEIR